MQFGKYFIDLSQPQVMGILNVTPDSFSDGGKHTNVSQALAHALRMIDEGATFIDIGGESTRPGAPDVSLQEELDRTIPVIEAVAKNTACVISIDTSKSEVMRQAIIAGADIINDVRALQEPGAIEVLAQYAEVAICLMHMQGQPRTMQANPQYTDVINDIQQFFIERISECENAGITRDKIILDPGFGFGKTLAHNYHILKYIDEFKMMGCEVLAGLSRKSMIGNLLGRDVDQRLAGSIAGALIAAQKGAKIIRVHDVTETADALNVWRACEQGITNEQ